MIQTIHISFTSSVNNTHLTDSTKQLIYPNYTFSDKLACMVL